MKKILLIVGSLVGVILAIVVASAPRLKAQDKSERSSPDSESRIQQGFAIAPVPLDLRGKNRALVGLGSYLVNGPGDCNACHNPGPGNNQFLHGGNPFFGEPKMVDPATYLGGGRDFGPLKPSTATNGIETAHIISRNLTPDKTGLPEGGRSFEDFLSIMRNGVDLDGLHPTCQPPSFNSSCIPPPFDGNLLQVMPWPNLQNMTDHDLRAIYEYLSAIPCVAGPPAPSPLHNDCH